MNELALFAGAGGGIMGGHLLGWRTKCAVELNPFCRSVLLQRQADGILPLFPIWDDVRTFDGKPWRGHIDIISAGFPCQDISSAGAGAGIDGERSGLWRDVARIAGEVRPRFLWLENSPLLVGRGLARVLGDIAKLGMHARWGVVGANDVGAPHMRKRIWLVAYTNDDRCKWSDVSLQQGKQREGNSIPVGCCEAVADTCRIGLEGPIHMGHSKSAYGYGARCEAPGGTEQACWQGDHPQPGILGMDDGLADWKHRIAAAGNGQVPRVVSAAWRMLTRIT